MADTVMRPLQLFTTEKLQEFRDMSLKARLVWLEEANSLAMKVLGPEKWAKTDTRFEFFVNRGRLTFADIDHLCSRIAEALHPEKIFLFGSYAEGTATEESDVDLLVVAESELSPHKRNIALKRLFPRRKFSLDAFVYTPSDYLKYKDVPGTIAYSAAHSGKLIYG
jgi:predicted nucleotidyltransferase